MDFANAHNVGESKALTQTTAEAGYVNWRQQDYAWTDSVRVEGLFVVLTIVIVPWRSCGGAGTCAPCRSAWPIGAVAKLTLEESPAMRPLRLVPDNTHIRFMRGRLPYASYMSRCSDCSGIYIALGTRFWGELWTRASERCARMMDSTGG